MADKLALMAEAERRGILPPPQVAMLNEARKRGLIPSGESPVQEEKNDPTEADSLPVRIPFTDIGFDIPASKGVANLAAGAGKAVVGAGTGLKQLAMEAGNKLGMVDDSTVAGLRANQDEVNKRDKPLMDTGAGLAGNIAGNVATVALPGAGLARGAQAVNAVRLANAARAISAPSSILESIASGAAIGAAAPVGTDEDRAMNVGLGAVGGGLGGGASSLLSRVVRPTAVPDAARRGLIADAQLRDIPLQVGDLTGSKPIQVLESVLSNTPGASGREQALRQTKQTAYNRAVGEAMGEQGVERLTPDVLRTVRTRLGGEFDRLSAGRTVTLGNDLLNALVDVDTATAPLRGILDTAEIDRLLNHTLDLASRGQVQGEVAQTIRSELSTASNDAMKRGETRLGNALRRVRNGIDDSIRGGLTPDEQAAWDVARNHWGNMRSVERAMSQNSNAASGDITGDSILNALKSSGTALGRQDNEMKTLGAVGRQFVKPQIPDSGTAQRTMIQNMLMAGGAGALGGGAAGVDPMQTGAAGAALPVAAMLAQPALRSQLMTRYLSQGLAPNASPQMLQLARALRGISGPAASSALLTSQ